MKKVIKTRIALLLIVTLTLSLCINIYAKENVTERLSRDAAEDVNAAADLTVEDAELQLQEDQTVYSGQFAGISWAYDTTTLTLTVSGKGSIPSTEDEYFKASWREYDYDVNCEKLVINEGITGIEDGAFGFMASISELELPSSLKDENVSEYAFDRFSGRMADENGMVIVAGILFTITDDAYDKDGKITVPKEVRIIRSGFSLDTSYIEVEQDNKYYVSVDGALFSKDLTELITYPAASTRTDYSLPDETRSLPSNFFYAARAVKNFHIGRGYKFNALDLQLLAGGNAGMMPDSITVSPENEDFSSENGALYSKDGTILYYYPRSAKEVIIGSAVTTIAYGALANCSALTELELPETVAKIEGWGIAGNKNLKKVDFSKSLETVGNMVLNNCPSLNEMHFYSDAPDLSGMKLYYKDDKGANQKNKVTAYYPAGNTTWTEDVKKDYGGEVTWVEETEKIEVWFNARSPMGDPNAYAYDITGKSYFQIITLNKGEALGDKVILPENYEGKRFTGWVQYVDGEPGELITDISSLVPEYRMSFDAVYEDITVDSVSLDKNSAELTVGDTLALTATVLPEDAPDKSVTWASSDSTVASVDANGKITAVKAGEATVTVTAKDGGKSATCKVTVKEPEKPAEPEEPEKPVDPDVQFSDVTSETVVPTSFKAISWAVDNGIVKGYDDGTFKPENICTREQFTIMLWRFAGEPSSDASAVNRFTDSADFSNNTSRKAVAWAVEQGVIKGFSDGSFRPEEDISRAQVAVMLWRFAGEESVSASSKFSDISSYSSNVQNAIIWEESNGVASGYKDGTFKPDDGCQRQHMAIFLNRFNSKIEQYKPVD